MRVNADVYVNDKLISYEKDMDVSAKNHMNLYSLLARFFESLGHDISEEFYTNDWEPVSVRDENGTELYHISKDKDSGRIGFIGRTAELVVDPPTGIAMIIDHNNGITYSCHPSIGVSASVNELKKRGMWKKDARVVMSRGVIYNIDAKILSSDTDRITSMFCKCHGCQEHRQHLRMHRGVFIQKEEADI